MVVFDEIGYFFDPFSWGSENSADKLMVLAFRSKSIHVVGALEQPNFFLLFQWVRLIQIGRTSESVALSGRNECVLSAKKNPSCV
jgi:hypothetical protein